MKTLGLKLIFFLKKCGEFKELTLWTNDRRKQVQEREENKLKRG